jgi:hypothetical protein
MQVHLSRHTCLLSLYTEIDEGHVRDTRSVYLVNDTREKRLFLLDRLTFHLFISIPARIAPEALRRFMHNSYAFVHYTSPFEAAKGGTAKGLAINEKNNRGIDSAIRGLLGSIDARNDKKFQSLIWTKRGGGGDDDEDDDDNTKLNLMQGLEEDCVPLKLTLGKKFANQNQYKLSFSNHLVAHYFVSRFLKGPVTFKEQEPFTVFLLAYERDIHNTRSLKASDRLFKERASDYIEGQLLQLAKDETTSFSFDRYEARHDGLLMPSAMENTSQLSHQYPNTFDNMETYKRSATPQGLFYQSLYVNLSTLYSVDGYTVIWLDYSERKVTFKPVKDVKPVTKKTKSAPSLSATRPKGQTQLAFHVDKKARLI